LEASLSAPSAEEQADSIVSSIEVLDRLSQFLTDSLDVAEANADALRLSRSEVDLAEAVGAMIDLYLPTFSERDLTLSFQCHGPVSINADPGLIHRAISNLFDNELTHLPTGHTVTVDLRVTDVVMLTLEDDGPGFAPEIIQHLFERRAKGRESSGHGLGLAFVDAVVRAHGGTVNASNRPTGGALITVRLPMALNMSVVAERTGSISPE
jgi:signal transduction histidine kinase